ncbi:aminopeptidase N [Candidatus Hamiltonella defensa]|uniref:Aminopeptidase N n=1 Tax=Candidatus Williamhamiltonella defendens TaxID=138072 RepID=A0AAC9VN49_9ENTR|nr:aminopeptidase N [Candidatus Hamiltonella defensa]ASV33932.1 aminopeptidase N [Candidatus Hamiltonella defensa]AWK16886.1 aminopeptidase N [Candidatus Hamiltonella defensa]MBK4361188.1 aminopeptidase N [Candidatus Hamiltonella defensa]
MTNQPQIKYRQDYRPPSHLISDIHLDFNLNEKKTRVTATSQIQRQTSEDTPLILNGENLILISVSVNDQIWPHYSQKDDHLIIEQLPKAFSLTIVNEIHPDKNTALEGLYLSGQTLCTQCESKGFRHITFFLDRPDVLARFTTRILADKKRYPYLLSNGNKIRQGELKDGRHWVEWADPFPKPSYLFALVAGDFDVLRDQFTTQSGRSVELELFVDKGHLDRADWAMSALKKAMKWDENRFGLEYDLDIYMIVAVDFFNMGAMENKGLNVFNSKYVLAKTETATDKDYLHIEAVIAHEYFHNWTGNRVTCRDWFQLSLKEGLTVFRDQEFSSDSGCRAVRRIENVRLMRSAQFAEDASPMAHPIRPDKVMEMNNFYTLTVYEKGAEVIRMLHTLLGESVFQAGMKRYISRHDGCAVTCDDFVQAMEDASGLDLTLFRRWYSQSGTPELIIRDHYDAQKQQYHLHVSQHTPPTADQEKKYPLHIPLDIELYTKKGEVIPLQNQGQPIDSVLNVIKAEQTFIFDSVSSEPVPSLLREFSAPVKLDYPYTDQQLICLMQNARNDFSLWDASQRLLNSYIKKNIAEFHENEPLTLPLHLIEVFRHVLLNDNLSPALIAEILTIPSENEIAELSCFIDPDAIHFVRQKWLRFFSASLSETLWDQHQKHQTPIYRVTHTDNAKRALKNICLQYLAFGRTDIADQRVKTQYQTSNNMTDTFAALTAAVAAQLPCRDFLLSDFESRWHSDPLVMDKWFFLQATRPEKEVVDKVRALLTHPSFSLMNPNRVRALLGAFASSNPVVFHAKDGAGYTLFLEILTTLNTQNPQVAARLIEPLIRFKRYDSVRQKWMKQVLEKLKALNNLSKDLNEKILKALED